MANTYTQLLIQYVFAVKHRQALIHENMRPSVQKYITGIATNNDHKLLAIYCMPDHCHILLGLNPKQSISDLASDIKANSSRWINENKLTTHEFNWQNGYGAFSYAKSQLDRVVKYILQQPVHHKKKSFKEEYIGILREFNVEFDDRYLFDRLE